jgi:CRISPR-associated protein (TIGR03986 family)
MKKKVEGQFLNPYHFVDVSGPTPKYPFKNNEKFHANSGYIHVEIKTESPLFIPSPEENMYMINDDMLEDNNRRIISKFCREFLENNHGSTQVYFLNNFSKWKEEKEDNQYHRFLKKRNGKENTGADEWIPAIIREVDRIDNFTSFELVSGLHFSGAHKKMKFFHYNGQPLLPSTSLKGWVRSTVETLSNSCFPHDYSGNTTLNFMCPRLNVKESTDSDEIKNLCPGMLKKKGEKWYFIELDQAKVLTVIDHYTPGTSPKAEGGKVLFAAKNKRSEIEKISTNSSTAGINGYINEKQKSRGFYPKMEVKHFKTQNCQITEINGEKLDKAINLYNKKFPYIDLASQTQSIPGLFAIIRKKKEKHRKKTFYLFKIKEIADHIADLELLLSRYRNPRYNKDVNSVEYDICQVYLKTSFDIETKTQDRLFFKFGEKNLNTFIDNCLKVNRAIPIDEKVFDQFQNLISQRFENLAHRQKNNPLLKFQPSIKDIRDGMLVYYFKGMDTHHGSPKKEPYLTYTQVARRPHRYGIAEILENMKKNRCSCLGSLCPACHIFGGVNIKEKNDTNHTNDKEQGKKISIGGKVSFSFGKCLKHNGFEETTLKPLGEPHPGFYQFYVLDNRKTANDTGENTNINYDTLQIKLGRKVYLKHNPDTLDYKDEGQSSLNVTAQLLKPGAVFSFRIHYFNLSHYELGLLLNSLDIQHNGRRLHYQLGLGKPLGLGRIKIQRLQVTKIDRIKRYSSLSEGGGKSNE